MTTDAPRSLVPARIVNEHAYCERLAYLMWVDGANADNAATLEGTFIHRNVDAPPAKRSDDAPRTVRSLTLGDEGVGVAARIDLVEIDGDRAVPIEYKRGGPWKPDEPLRAPERLQLLAQVALLRAHGYCVERMEVWFDGARRRVAMEVPADAEELVARTVAAIRSNADRAQAPPPLVDDPRCPHCVLVGLCLPDEHAVERGERARTPACLPRRHLPRRCI